MENLQQEIEKLQGLKNIVDEIMLERDNKIKESIKFYVSLGIKETDECRYSFESIYFYRERPGHKSKDEILSINFRGSRKGDWKVMEEIYVNFYTTTDTSDYQLKRLVTLGKVAGLVLENKKNMIDDFNRITKKYELKLKEPEQAYYEQRGLVDDLRANNKLSKESELLDKYSKEQLVIGYENKQNLRVNRRKHFNSIIGLQILNITKSGKQVDVELERQSYTDDLPHKESVRLKREVVIGFIKNILK